MMLRPEDGDLDPPGGSCEGPAGGGQRAGFASEGSPARWLYWWKIGR